MLKYIYTCPTTKTLKLNNQNKCLCFKHNETNPSMSFDSKTNKFKDERMYTNERNDSRTKATM